MLIVSGFHEKLRQDKQRKDIARNSIEPFLSSRSVEACSCGDELGRELSTALMQHISIDVFVESYDLINLKMFWLVAKISNADMGIDFFQSEHEKIKRWLNRILKTDTTIGTPTQKLTKIFVIPECVAKDIEGVILKGDFNHSMFELTAHTTTQFLARYLACEFIDYLDSLANTEKITARIGPTKDKK